jgi:uridine monophosphate synthetase
MDAPNSFFAKLEAAAARNNSLLCVGLDPVPAQIPQKYQHDDGNAIASILTWNRAIVESTSDLVCVYKPNIAFYEALGIPGIELLRRTLALIPADTPVLLDAKRGDIGSTSEAYARACFEQLDADAVTLNVYLGRDAVEPFLRYRDRGLFILCHTSNPGAADFQELEINDWRTLDREPNQPLYIHIARTALTWGSNIGLVVGATYPEALARVRQAAPHPWILVPGIGSQGGDLAATVRAGLRRDRSGIMINASRSIAQAGNHRQAADSVRNAINQAREEQADPAAQPIAKARPSAAPWSLLAGLTELRAIQFGDFKLASGIRSPFYIDLRLLVSDPPLLAQVAAAYASVLSGLSFDRIAGVPYAALPIGTAVALHAGAPLIYMRKELKEHGLGKEIEGVYQPGEKVVIIEDLATSGGSILKTVERLRAAGLVVEDAIVLIDREQGGPANLAAAGVTLHSVFKLRQMLHDMVATGILPAQQAQNIFDFLDAGAQP